MSFIIAVHVKEGIVLASDSRTTYTETTKSGKLTTIKYGTHTTDTTNKTFLCPNNIGISTCGDSSLCGAPITGYIESFIREKITEQTNITSVPQMLIEFFNATPEVPDTTFIVAGYSTIQNIPVQCVYTLNVKKKSVSYIDTTFQGAKWCGETQTMSKIIQTTYMKDAEGTEISLGETNITWGLFTLQDAINFARYAIETTINTMRYSNVVETVGGPIDILVIKPDQAFWIQRKELHG